MVHGLRSASVRPKQSSPGRLGPRFVVLRAANRTACTIFLGDVPKKKSQSSFKKFSPPHRQCSKNCPNFAEHESCQEAKTSA